MFSLGMSGKVRCWSARSYAMCTAQTRTPTHMLQDLTQDQNQDLTLDLAKRSVASERSPARGESRTSDEFRKHGVRKHARLTSPLKVCPRTRRLSRSSWRKNKLKSGREAALSPKMRLYLRSHRLQVPSALKPASKVSRRCWTPFIMLLLLQLKPLAQQLRMLQLSYSLQSRCLA